MGHFSFFVVFLLIYSIFSRPLKLIAYTIPLLKSKSDCIGKKIHHSDYYCSAQANAVHIC